MHKSLRKALIDQQIAELAARIVELEALLDNAHKAEPGTEAHRAAMAAIEAAIATPKQSALWPAWAAALRTYETEHVYPWRVRVYPN